MRLTGRKFLNTSGFLGEAGQGRASEFFELVNAREGECEFAE